MWLAAGFAEVVPLPPISPSQHGQHSRMVEAVIPTSGGPQVSIVFSPPPKKSGIHSKSVVILVCETNKQKNNVVAPYRFTGLS